MHVSWHKNVGDGVDGNYFIMIPFFGCSLSSSREVFFTHNTTAGVIKKKNYMYVVYIIEV